MMTSDVLSPDKLALIRQLNDALRTTFKGGTVLMTGSVAALPDMVRAAALMEMAQFSAFDESNDPYGEHDFGRFELCNRTFLFQIAYYGRTYDEGSEDPADANKTRRVLTLMLAEDY